MSDATRPVAGLSAQEKRELLKQLLQEKANKSKAVAPLSYGQRALWFLYQLAPDSAAYNVTFAVRVRSEMDIPAMRRAFQALIARHAALHTTYAVQSGEPVQEVHGFQEAAFEEVEASGWDEKTLVEQTAASYQRPFDLERGPVTRLTLFSRSAVDHVLQMVVHHIAVDGWSLGILIDELQALYVAETTGVLVLPPPTVQYVDFVNWQRELLAGPEGERLRSYWLQKLSGDPSTLPPVAGQALPTLN
ncbi:MAG: condensation domain-containing protein, partial [Chloroflexota bacterium]